MISLDTIRAAHRSADLQIVRPVLAQAGTDATKILRGFEATERDNDTVSFLRLGQELALAALRLSRDGRSDEAEKTIYRELALNVAEDFHRRYLPPSGGFIEYDRCSWLEPHRLWRTVPWGTAFRGREMLSVWQELRGDLSPESALWWQDALERVGRWLHGNPTLGSFVFNYALDGCYLLWRLGRALARPDWTEWAMRTAHARIERDVDGEGWIQGEEGGCSGNYQIVGTRFLALFAWESNDEVLKATIGRISNVLLQWSTPNLLYPGNFGTRTNALYPLQGHRAEFLLVTAEVATYVGGMKSSPGSLAKRCTPPTCRRSRNTSPTTTTIGRCRTAYN